MEKFKDSRTHRNLGNGRESRGGGPTFQRLQQRTGPTAIRRQQRVSHALPALHEIHIPIRISGHATGIAVVAVNKRVRSPVTATRSCKRATTKDREKKP